MIIYISEVHGGMKINSDVPEGRSLKIKRQVAVIGGGKAGTCLVLVRLRPGSV